MSLTLCLHSFLSMVWSINFLVCQHLNKMGLLNANNNVCLMLLRPLGFNPIFHLPSKESVLTTTYLINLFPTHFFSKKIYFEKRYNRITFSHLHVFVMPLMSNLNTNLINELESVLCWISPGQKAYKVHDLVTKQFFSNWNVVFHEDMFSFFTIP